MDHVKKFIRCSYKSEFMVKRMSSAMQLVEGGVIHARNESKPMELHFPRLQRGLAYINLSTYAGSSELIDRLALCAYIRDVWTTDWFSGRPSLLARPNEWGWPSYVRIDNLSGITFYVEAGKKEELVANYTVFSV